VPDSGGVLYIVATPIGNLADISQRALDILKSVDLVAAEDTRHSQKLLAHYGINQQMMALHEHNERERANEIINRVLSGQSIALISDAGTPLISDPGYFLVRMAHDANLRIVPVPGASAMVTALSAAGLPTDHFWFEGFLPAKSAARSKRLAELQQQPATIVFYEAPHRLLETVSAICEAFGGSRRIALLRELTKTYETVMQKSCEEMRAFIELNPEQQKGESVLVVEGNTQPKGEQYSAQVEIEHLLAALLRVMSVREAARTAAELTGHPKNSLYQQALSLADKKT
jgi:16S rRNA (cytidine1402-2'-O)-methyltransferase